MAIRCVDYFRPRLELLVAPVVRSQRVNRMISAVARSKRCKSTNVGELFLAQAVQFFLAEATRVDQVGEDERKHGVTVVVPGINVLALVPQIILQLPQLARLLDMRGTPRA